MVYEEYGLYYEYEVTTERRDLEQVSSLNATYCWYHYSVDCSIS
jgi:hypothetical protein